MFDKISTKTRCADILTAPLLPFIQNVYPEWHRLYQDNNPKHASRDIQEYFKAGTSKPRIYMT